MSFLDVNGLYVGTHYKSTHPVQNLEVIYSAYWKEWCEDNAEKLIYDIEEKTIEHGDSGFDLPGFFHIGGSRRLVGCYLTVPL